MHNMAFLDERRWGVFHCLMGWIKHWLQYLEGLKPMVIPQSSILVASSTMQPTMEFQINCCCLEGSGRHVKALVELSTKCLWFVMIKGIQMHVWVVSLQVSPMICPNTWSQFLKGACWFAQLTYKHLKTQSCFSDNVLMSINCCPFSWWMLDFDGEATHPNPSVNRVHHQKLNLFCDLRLLNEDGDGYCTLVALHLCASETPKTLGRCPEFIWALVRTKGGGGGDDVEGVFGGGCQTKGLRVRICGACSSTVLSSWMEVSKRPRWGWFWSQSRRGGEGGVASHHGAKTAFACWHYYYVSCCLKAWHYHLHLAHLTVSGGGTSFVNHSLGCPFWEKRSRVLSESRTSSKQLKGQSLTLCSVKQQRLHWSNKPE